MEKKINELLLKLITTFYDNRWDLFSFAYNLKESDKVVWYKDEPYHFVNGYKKEVVLAKDIYACNEVTEHITIGNAIFNPYEVYILSKERHNCFYSDYNIAFVMGNFMLHWDHSDDKLSLYVKNTKEEFKPCLNGFEVENSLLKASYRRWGENNMYKSSKHNKELYAFVTVIHNEFLKYLKK